MNELSIIVGSHREDSQSTKVAKFIEHTAAKLFSHVTVNTLNLAGNPLPLWDESFWKQDPKWNASWKPFSEKLSRSDAAVVISPEWGGMAPAGLKNFFLFCQGELSHKPGYLVAVSAGPGGAYPVAELRMSSYKNSQLCYIPEHAIVRKVESVLNNLEKADSPDDQYIRARIEYGIKLLGQYAHALKQVRESGVPDRKNYPFGM